MVRPLSIHVWDSDVTDSTVAVHVSSKKDKTGFSVLLHAATGSAGDFNGRIWFSLKGSAPDSVLMDTLHVTGTAVRSFVGTAGFTTGLSHPGFISVQDGDSVMVSYQDDSPVQTVTQSAMWSSK